MSATFAKISACGIGDAATLMVSPFPGVMSNLPSSVVASVSILSAASPPPSITRLSS